MLTTTNHDRDAVGMRYIYPVASRRAGGLSIGVNLNPNNACNWRCCYCQVPNLVRGHAPAIDLSLLREELSSMLQQVLQGNFLQHHLPNGMQRLCDVAISGNGEPTSSMQFADIVALLTMVMGNEGVDPSVPLRLITNGSYCGREVVQQGLRAIAHRGGEIWMKVDGGDAATISRINGVSVTAERLCQQVTIAASSCPTWIQTCMVAPASDGALPKAEAVDGYLQLLAQLAPSIEGVHLYAPVRPSHQQPTSPLPRQWMERLASDIAAMGIKVHLA